MEIEQALESIPYLRKLAAHEVHHVTHNAMGGVYQYDSADDGPECEVITRILAAYPNEVRVR